MEEGMISFDTDDSQICKSVTVNDDSLSEDIEEFLVLIRPVSPRVTVDNVFRVFILDTDSKYLLHSLTY